MRNFITSKINTELVNINILENYKNTTNLFVKLYFKYLNVKNESTLLVNWATKLERISRSFPRLGLEFTYFLVRGHNGGKPYKCGRWIFKQM